ncbi:hypothetical protein F0225_07810 [Vibrio pectenicida]|uniref:Uncharacterized protein n=1 Tax=Vibrio pectenicida TaxID=62763 RepID=A0A7Y4EEA1_9VIBR|nr:hypothetical protein [Vibrio pectenicida]NOH71242.1 hypothetical protein [Vibrio pectenicida]
MKDLTLNNLSEVSGGGNKLKEILAGLSIDPQTNAMSFQYKSFSYKHSDRVHTVKINEQELSYDERKKSLLPQTQSLSSTSQVLPNPTIT